MSDPMHILMIDSDNRAVETARKALEDDEIIIVTIKNIQAINEELTGMSFATVVCDFGSSGKFDLKGLERVRRRFPHTPLIATTASYDSSTAIEAVKGGAFDFLPKPYETGEFRKAINEALECSKKTNEPVYIDPRNEFDDDSDTLVGNSRAMLDVYKILGRLSPTPVTVLIRGETGTGKELVARALYQHGHRAHRPLITVNCAAIPDNLLESELFGHEKGSFTGATSTRIGKFEQANNATLFLDEIGDLDHSLQAKLLRVLQEKRFQRVGGNNEISVDVRIIAATHRPIERMITEGEFREDLFYRLNVATIKLPPLRDRVGDIPLLCNFFSRRFSKELGFSPVPFTKRAISRLESATLPGNVRQLQNIVRKALLRSRGYSIDDELIESLLDETEPPENRTTSGESIEDWCRQLVAQAADDKIDGIHEIAVERVEAALIEEALKKSNGDISQASKWLGLSRLTLREKGKKFGILSDR